MVAEFLDEAENVIPAAAVEARRMLSQFPQDLVHFKRRQYGLNQHGGADGAARNPQFLLRHDENIVPETGLQVAFQLGQIEVRSCALGNQPARIVKEVQAEIKE